MVIVQLTTDNREPFREYDKPEPWFGTAPEALLQGFARRSDVTVHVVSCTQQPMRSPGKLAPNIWFHSLHVPKMGWLRTGYQGCIRATRRKLREIRPDIVHGQGTERDCSLSAVYSGFPNVLTIHGNMRLVSRINRARPFSYQWIAARLEGVTIPRSDGVVCITRYTQEAVKGSARRTWVVPNAVDASFFDVRRERADVATLLCAGVICSRKNQLQLIRALDGLNGQRPIRLLFLGVGPEGDPYSAEFFRMLATRPWCEHGGFASRERLKAELSRATAVVLPSLEDNCPMVVLEAMAAKVPVVAANVGGVPDLVEDGVTGFLCHPDDASSIRAAVEKVLDHRLAPEMVDRARTEALARFHPEAVAERHLEIYAEVLKTLS